MIQLKTPKNIRLCIRIDNDLWQYLAHAAASSHMSISDYVRLALRDAVTNYIFSTVANGRAGAKPED